MKSDSKNLFMSLGGLATLLSGLFLIKLFPSAEGVLRVFPYLLVGLGVGLFGHGTGALLQQKAIKNNPAAQKQLKIELTDERNVAISNKAKAKAYDSMVPVFGALMLALALMGTELTAILLLVAAYLIVIGCGVYYRIKFEKEM